MSDPVVVDGQTYDDQAAATVDNHPFIPDSIKRLYVGPIKKDEEPVDYDYASWQKANPGVEMAPGQHYPDTYKLPNHMTFSNESIYHGIEGNQGGSWGTDDQGNDTFTPGPTNFQYHTLDELKDYFRRVEPDVKLIIPDSAAGMASQATEKAADALKRAQGTPPTVDSDTGIDGPVTITIPWLRKAMPNLDSNITEGDYDRAKEVALAAGAGVIHDPTLAGPLQIIRDILGSKKSNEPIAVNPEQEAKLQETLDYWDRKEAEYQQALKGFYDSRGAVEAEAKAAQLASLEASGKWSGTTKTPGYEYEQMGNGKYEIFESKTGKTYATVDSLDKAKNFDLHEQKPFDPNDPIYHDPFQAAENIWNHMKQGKHDEAAALDVIYGNKFTDSSFHAYDNTLQKLVKEGSKSSDSEVKTAMDEIEKILNAMEKQDAAQKAGVKNIPITENPLFKQKPLYYHEKTASWEDFPEEVEKLSPKEAFKKGVVEASMKFKTAIDNIRSGFRDVIDEPKLQPPKVQGVGSYTEPAYKGMYVNPKEGVNPVFDFSKAYGEIYSTASPRLAEMYSHMSGKPPGYNVPEGHFGEGSTVVPLLIDTSKYLTYDAKGKSYVFVNDKAIEQAHKEGYLGVKMINVHDEPANTTHLPPQTVYITLPKGASTVKSRFAKKFDPTDPNMLHVIPAIGVTGAAGTVAYNLNEENPIINEQN